MAAPPIFVVGVQRSGTTLLAAMLAAHSRLSCGPETHFFRWLSRVDPHRLCDATTWPQPAAQFITSIDHTDFNNAGERKTLLAKYQLEEASVPVFLQSRTPSIANILSSVTEQYMTARQKERWVEKTPDHLLHTATIREFFPDSPIVRIVRDPRDVALSLTKVPWGAGSFFEGLLYWERLDRLSREFFLHDPLSYTLRFEDLVSSPTETLQGVCRFIDETFEEGMLDTSRTGAEINSRNVAWKAKVAQSADASRTAAWRSELTVSENRLAESFLGDRIEALGYARTETFGRPGDLHPDVSLAAKYPEALGVVASDGVRFWKTSPDERSKVSVYLGEPGSKEWQSGEKVATLIDALPVLADIAKAAVADRHLYWIADRGDHRWTGCVPFVLKKCLSPYRVRVEAVGR